jgi:cytochrome P450
MSENPARFTQVTKNRNRRLPPGPQGYLLLKLSALQHQPIEYLGALWQTYGDLVRLPVMPWLTMIFAAHPNHAEHILSQHPNRYIKPDFFLKPMGLVQGKGLFSSEGEYWRKQRRLMQPAFQQKQLVNLYGMMWRCIEELLLEWECKPEGEVFDIAAAMTQLTLKILGLTLFSVDISEESDRLGQSLRTALEYVYYRLNTPFALPTWVPTPRNLKFRQAKKTLDEVVFDIIQARRQHPIEQPDLLSILLSCRDEETGESMSDRELQDELITLINAGHETTATTLAWTWYLLGLHPEVMAKLQDEIQLVLQGNPLTFEHLPQLQYTRQVFYESARVCPAGFAMAPRVALEDDEIQGYFIPKGSILIIAAYFTWRHPDFWENPDQFNPDRFALEQVHQRSKFVFQPFGSGPHTCIGKNYALMESTAILAGIIQRFQIELLPNQPIEIDPRFTLRPKYGIKVRVHKRS